MRELMVMGDSLAQGCRSLSVTPGYCAESYGKIIADSQGWEFAAPDFRKRPVLFDLEEAVGSLGLSVLGHLYGQLKKMESNLRAWEADFRSGRKLSEMEGFDNVAIAGATLEEIRSLTAARCAEVMREHEGRAVRELLWEDPSSLGLLHLAINARFCLNPSQSPKFAGYSQMDWVRERQPRRLIVHGGHNDGLYRVGGGGELARLCESTLPAYRNFLQEILALPESIRILVVLLPKVSAAANLHPLVNAGKVTASYYETYEPVFSLCGEAIRGCDLRAIDGDIVAINRELAAMIRNSGRANIDVLDAYHLFERYDFKNTRQEKRRIRIGRLVIDNTYLETRVEEVRLGSAKPFRRHVFASGGFQGLDGMHLTAVGYAVLACEIMKKWKLPHHRDKILEEAAARERLITNYPTGWRDAVLGPLRYLRLVKVKDRRRHEAELLEGGQCSPFTFCRAASGAHQRGCGASD
jgi:hypothetical protein